LLEFVVGGSFGGAKTGLQETSSAQH